MYLWWNACFRLCGFKHVQTWRWLYYDETNNKVYCFYCAKKFKEKKLKAPNVEPAFVTFRLVIGLLYHITVDR